MAAPYRLLPFGGVLLGAAQIPPDTGNMDWRDYQAWRALGNTPDPADPLPTPVRAITAYRFMMRFSDPERAAIRVAAAADPAGALADLYARQTSAQTIDLDDVEVIGGLAMLTGAGILAVGRAAEILA